ncbi:outer membrane protein [Sphingomonas kyeonggiensis]|uniref:outer membrane protein n=1 Tax=Sphingomonas kyeonggiensis TaxID=1268553 RepID=UPI0027D8C8E4|nr:porin family protein [Sphingomonas kyeonggiensis]
MGMIKHATLAILASAAFAVPAMAQDSTSFTGPRIGVEGGWSRVGGEHRAGGDGFTYGATLGYDVAAGNLRFGPEIEVSDSTQKECRAIATGGRDCERADRDLYAGARIGYVAAPSLLLYGKGGYTNARFSDRIENAGASDMDSADNRSGYRIGAGAEYAVTRNVYVSGEYRYSHWSSSIHQNQLLAGVGLRF